MILYVTFDGLLQPLGRSQVLRYIEKLVERGWKFGVLSLERPADLADSARVASVADHLESLGVEWLCLRYRPGGPREHLQNFTDAALAALDFAASRDLVMTHARSYHGAVVALLLKAVLDVPYLFDMRGYWVDERRDSGRWFGNPALHRLARVVERELYRRSTGIVSLARPAAEDIRGGRFGAWEGPLAVIPTCVDPDEFVSETPRPDCVPRAVAQALHNRLVVGFVGSINESYRVREGFELFRGVLSEDREACLLCLTQQVEMTNAMLDEVGIPSSARLVTSVPHEEISAWLTMIDWGLLLLNEPFAKRASMPTKLGEFFATGVRPVVYGCNEEVREWAQASGTGLVLDDTQPPSLRAAARTIAASGKSDRSAVDLRRARELTMRHFSLHSGVDRYDAMYREVLATRRTA